MNANRINEFQEHLVSSDFLKFCEAQDQPVQSFERNKSELYLRSIGYTRKPVPELDQAVAREDLSLFYRGFKVFAKFPIDEIK